MKHDGLDLNLLRVFDALWHTRKVAAAAERLALTPPALSNALARLRRATGDELFTRTAQGMLPTPHATAIAPALTQALAQVAASLAPRSRSFSPGGSDRAWTIAMTDIGEITFLPRLLSHLAEHAPHLRVHTVRNSPAETRERMARGSVDMAVGWLPDLDAGFHQRRLFEQRYVCLMAAGHVLTRGRLTLARLARARHVAVQAEGTGHERIDRLLRQHGLERGLPLALPHFVTLPFILSGSDLVAIVPFKLAEQVRAPLALSMRELPFALPRFEVNLFWHHRVHADAAHRWMRECWVQLFAERA